MDIKVNQDEWTALSREDQQQIEAIITGYFKGGRIVPDPTTPPSEGQLTPEALNEGFCEAACNIAEAAAKAACNQISNPILKATCLAAATQGGILCRSNC